MAIERGSDKHSPRLDEALAHDVGSMTGSTPVEARVEEFREQEGPADGEPTPDVRISGDRGSPSPDLLTFDELEARSDLARHIQPSVFPATREELIGSATRLHAPDAIIATLSRLPDGTFTHLEAVWEALGGREEFRGA